METLFKNTTKYTKTAYNKYLQFHQHKYGTKYQFNTIITILLLSFCIITNFKYSNYPVTLLLLAVIIIFTCNRFIQPTKKINKELKTEKFVKEKEFTFTFYENYFTIAYDNETAKIKYRKLYKIFESEEYFYLYIDKNHAFLLNKSTFSIGNIYEFIPFLKKKMLINIFL